MNPLYSDFGAKAPAQNPISYLKNQIQAMKNSLQGNPKDIVQALINNGQMSQEQFNQYSAIANNLINGLN